MFYQYFWLLDLFTCEVSVEAQKKMLLNLPPVSCQVFFFFLNLRNVQVKGRMNKE